MTITEKILAQASGKSKVSPGDVVFAKIDKVMMHDVSGPGVIKVFSELEKKKGKKLERIWDPDRVWITEDHFVPAVDRVSAENVIALSNWTKKFGIKKHFKYGLGHTAFAILYHTRRHWYLQVRYMLEEIPILILLEQWEHLLPDLVIQILHMF